MKKLNRLLIALFFAGTLASCAGGGGGGGPVYTWRTSPFVTIDQFVESLNYVDGTYGSFVENTEIFNEYGIYLAPSYRTLDEGLDDWYVIWDAYNQENIAVSIQFLQGLEYYDYVQNTDSLAAEFRVFQSEQPYNGDFWGDYFEVVDYDYYTDSFWGRQSGFEYDEEAKTTDVNLMAAKKESDQFIRKAAALSAEYKLDIKKSMSLVSLGAKVVAMTKGKSEISAEDLSVISKDLTSITGVSVELAMKAATDPTAKKEMLETAAESFGTTSSNIEQKVLPELFGIEL